jgi:hypothetical protein
MAQETSALDFASAPSTSTSHPSNLRPESAGTRDPGMLSEQSSRHTSLTLDSCIGEIKPGQPIQQQIEEQSSNASFRNVASCDALPTPNSRPPLSILLAYIALCVSIFLVALDTVLIPTALPTISLSFHIPDSLYAWTGSAYLLANASSIPFWGKLSDVFGRKPVILVANTIFLSGSIICAVSVNAPMLVAGRAVQGLGGGGVVVLVYVCVSDLFSIR